MNNYSLEKVWNLLPHLQPKGLRIKELHVALDRVYKLAMSLSEAPLYRFKAKTANLPRTTEAERWVIQRIRQDVFRAALLDYWDTRCPLTGITDPALLRASHIVPWSDCNDDQRLDVHNGLLLSALWDAAFDQGLISFAGDGTVRASPKPKRREWHLGLTQCHHSRAFRKRIAPISRSIERATVFDPGRRVCA